MTLRIKTVGGMLVTRFYILEGLDAVRKTLRLPIARRLTWVMEKIGGGGNVTGIAISPDGLTRIVKTDVGGGNRWDPVANLWQPMITEESLPVGENGWKPYFGEGVQAVAASNTACYMGYLTSIYKSVDRGVTWANVKTGIGTGAGGANANNQRTWQPHMVVDPNNNNRVLYGTYDSGVWYSLNAGSTWTQVPSGTVPFGLTDGGPADGGQMGIPVVGIHPSTGDFWVCPFGQGVYRSTTSGSTWTKTSSDAMFVTATSLGFLSTGDILTTGQVSALDDGSDTTLIYKFSGGAWSPITLAPGSPSANRAWRTMAVDPITAGRVVIQAQGGYTLVSLNNGTTWTWPTTSWNDFETDVTWLPVANSAGNVGVAAASGAHFTTTGGLQFDPVVAGRIWMSQGIGVWYADMPAPANGHIPWTTRTRGIEEMVVNDVIVPPGGYPLALCWDRPIFGLRESGDAYPTHYHPVDQEFSSCWQADWSADDPTFIVANVANHQNNGTGTPAETGYSTDRGHTWTPFPTVPLNSTNATTVFGFGEVHVSGNHVIWVGNNSHGAYRSPDLGATWTKIVLPGVIPDSSWNQKPYFVLRQIATAEKTAGHQGTFYAFILNQGFYRSLDGGATWTQRSNNTPFTLYSGTTWEWHAHLKSVPDQVGHLFLTSGRLGNVNTPVTTTPLLKSADGGATWTDTSMRQVSAFDLGKPPPGSTYPAIYAYGVGVSGLGLYRSTDGGTGWTFLSPAAPVLKAINGIAASKDTYGLVWLGTSGQSVARGEYVNVG